MSLKNCLPGLVENGKVSKEQAAEAEALYDDLFEANRATMGDAAAAAHASREAVDALAADVAQRRRQTVLQMQAQTNIGAFLNRHVEGGGRITDAARAVLARNERAPGILSLEERRLGLRRMLFRHMGEVMERFSPDLIGRLRNKADLANVVRELFGETTGDKAAKELAAAFSTTAETARQMFNQAGGAIGKRKDWGLPQSHDSDAVLRAGYEKWRETVRPLLAIDRMVDDATGKPFSPQRLELALRSVWETIASEGWDKRTPGSASFRPKMGNRHADPRFLVFKDADSWLSYQAEFGGKVSAYDAMLAHIDLMARDIAAIQALGPNPAASVEWLRQTVMKDGSTGATATPDTKELARNAVGRIDAMWSTYTGAFATPVSRTLARTMGTIRNVTSSIKMGGATLTALSDLALGAANAKWNDLPVLGVFRDQLTMLNPLSAADRETARFEGLIVDTSAADLRSNWRYDMPAELAAEWSRRLNSLTIRASGLDAWTQRTRWGFQMAMQRAWGTDAAKPWSNLSVGRQRQFERYGITAADWQQMRRAQLFEENGFRFMRPDDMQTNELALKLHAMLEGEGRIATLEPDLETRAILSGARSGAFVGELAKSAMQLKTFSVAFTSQVLGRALYGKGGISGAEFAARAVIGSTVLGTVSLWLKDIADGKDPRSMDNAAAVGQALLQGGGLGIYGDFIGSAVSRDGKSFASTFIPPSFGVVSDAIAATGLPSAARFARDEDQNWGRDVARFVNQDVPVFSSLWYARAGWRRLIADQVQMEIDDDYADSFRRMERKAREDDKPFWWAPGHALPDRAPDLTNAGGGE